MRSILTVVTPATSVDLTILSTVKAELGITSSAEDANIETWIDQASAACTTYCNRVFAEETVRETFRFRRFWNDGRDTLAVLMLERFPVTDVVSIVQDSSTLVEGTDFEVDIETGRVFRLSNGDLSDWQFSNLVVTYTAGYELLGGLPMGVERACINLVKHLRANAERDPALRSESLLSGLYSYTLSKGGDIVSGGGLPPDVEGLLGPYRNIGV